MAGLSIVATIVSIYLWVLDSLGKWDKWGVDSGHDATIACTFITVTLWLSCARWRRSDRLWTSIRAEFRRREGAIIRVADRMAGAPTKPFRRIP